MINIMEIIMSEPTDIRGPEPPHVSTAAISAEHSKEVLKHVQHMTGIHSITDSKATYVKVVDRVYIRSMKNKKGQNKLCQRWIGPYKVLAQKSLFHVILQLRNQVTGKQIHTHIGDLKIFMRTQ